jgi:hypothetical protein
MRDENATPGPKCKEYARVFNAMRTLDPILEAHGGLYPSSSQTEIGPLSKIPSDFKALQLLLLRLLGSISHSPGFFTPAGAIPRRLRMLWMPSPVQVTGVYFTLFFAKTRQDLTNFVN